MIYTEITDHLPPQTQAIRQEVFMGEQGFSYEFDETDAAALHLTLYEDGRAVGCCRLFPGEAPGAWHVGRVAVRRECRGRGLGARIMLEAEKAALARGGTRMELSAQVRAAGFYQGLGYVQEGEEYLEEQCPHIPMTKQISEMAKEG